MQISLVPTTALDTPGSFSNPMPLWKRGLDLICCTLALPILALAFVVMAGITWLVSPGPVLFRQERIGLAGSRFRIFKFRTMEVNSDQTVHSEHFKQLIDSNEPMVKLDSQRDRRLIPGGWLLRATGLDELPQVINVLRGEMSIVGPRPCIPSEFEQFQPAQRARADAVPGLTGLWQVSGKNRTTFEEMINLDIRYARSVSLPLDLEIMLRTPVALGQQVYDTRRRRVGAARNGAIPSVSQRPSSRPTIAAFNSSSN